MSKGFCLALIAQWVCFQPYEYISLSFSEYKGWEVSLTTECEKVGKIVYMAWRIVHIMLASHGPWYILAWCTSVQNIRTSSLRVFRYHRTFLMWTSVAGQTILIFKSLSRLSPSQANNQEYYWNRKRLGKKGKKGSSWTCNICTLF